MLKSWMQCKHFQSELYPSWNIGPLCRQEEDDSVDMANVSTCLLSLLEEFLKVFVFCV